jgi:hypothetical protein
LFKKSKKKFNKNLNWKNKIKKKNKTNKKNLMEPKKGDVGTLA